jgi:hypothetical protein
LRRRANDNLVLLLAFASARKDENGGATFFRVRHHVRRAILAFAEALDLRGGGAPPTNGGNMRRREFVQLVLGASVTGGVTTRAQSARASAPFTVQRELFLKSPASGTGVGASSYYTRKTGTELLCRHRYSTRSDTSDRAFLRFSPDNGKTWSEPRETFTVEHRAGGTFRRSVTSGLVDPTTGALVEFRIEGLFEKDQPLERLRGYSISYGLSHDGGRTWAVESPVIHSGAEFSVDHPLPGVWRGKNCAYIGDLASAPLALADGTLILPIQIVPLGPDGKLFNPGGGYTFTHAAALRGTWRADKTLTWEMSSVVQADPALSTRGMIEPTIAELADGQLLMVMRGSNDKNAQAFGGKWTSFSKDAGRTWTSPRLWTYTDGARFFSPSACSQLVPHSSGRLFWLGNITPTNPAGNRPRYPFIVGEVDRRNGLLKKETVTVVDDRGEGDGELLSLSNFYAREDRETHEIVVHMSRQGARSTTKKADFTADAFLYRISVT